MPKADALACMCNSDNDLLLLTLAAAAAGICRNHFWRLFREQRVPPAIMITTQCRWSRRQIELWLQGKIRRNEYGIWEEWDADTEQFRKLPNQYLSTLPQDAA